MGRTIQDRRARLLELLAADIPAGSGGRTLVAVDGVDGSGKSTFAAGLAAAVRGRPVVLIHADDFLNLRAVRHRRGRQSPEGFWLDTYDYGSLLDYALLPLGRGGSGLYRPAATDYGTDRYVEVPAVQSAADALVIVEGMFLHRDELVAVWDYSVFLDVPFAETARRMHKRDGTNPDPEHPSMARYVGGQRLYFEAAQPWRRASRVVDNSNPIKPRVMAAEDVGRRLRVHAPAEGECGVPVLELHDAETGTSDANT